MKKMIRQCLVAVMLIVVFNATFGFANTENAFQRRAEIKLDGSGYRAVKITPDIYSNSSPNLADIVIMSDDGTIIPYFIYEGGVTEGLTVPFAVAEDDGTTIVTLHGVRNLPLVNIRLMTDSMFKRRVSVGHTQMELFNLMFEDASYQDLTLPMNGYRSQSDELTLLIFNNDDAPIQLDNIEIDYRPGLLVFESPQSGTAYVFYGNPDITSPPQYDIVNYMDWVLERGFEVLELGEPEILSTSPARHQARDLSLFYNILIILTAIVLIVIIVFRFKKIRK